MEINVIDNYKPTGVTGILPFSRMSSIYYIELKSMLLLLLDLK
jgi:hypothetical protein